MCAMGEPSGPIENGTTYKVRPTIEPANKGFKVARMSAGSIQLLVGPASSFLSEQIKVRSSTRATSDGSEQAKKELGRLDGFKRFMVPLATICSHSKSYSAWLPSHQWTWAAWVRLAMSCTQANSRVWWTCAGALIAMVGVLMQYFS